MTANLPAKIETIPAIDRNAPERTERCLPQWLKRSVLAVNADHQGPTISGAMALTPAQRTETERHVASLDKASRSGPEERIGAAIMGVLAAFPAQATSAEATKARSIMYREALADLPAWSVERAVAFWNRAEHSEGRENYAFPPSPPQLRRLARIVSDPVRHQLGELRRLLDAEVIPEPTAKEADTKRRIDELVAKAFRPKTTPNQAAEQGR